MDSQLPPNRTALIIIYKILNDLLFLCLVFFGLALIADGMIPGIVTDHISFLKIILFLFLLFLAIYALGRFLDLNFDDQKINKKTALVLAAFSALIIFNSLYKINVILALFITAIAMASGYFIYKNVLD